MTAVSVHPDPEHPVLCRRVLDSFQRHGRRVHLSARQGATLHAVGRLVRGGKRIIVTTAEVVHVDAAGQRADCALMQQTLVPVPRTD